MIQRCASYLSASYDFSFSQGSDRSQWKRIFYKKLRNNLPTPGPTLSSNFFNNSSVFLLILSLFFSNNMEAISRVYVGLAMFPPTLMIIGIPFIFSASVAVATVFSNFALTLFNLVTCYRVTFSSNCKTSILIISAISIRGKYLSW